MRLRPQQEQKMPALRLLLKTDWILCGPSWPEAMQKATRRSPNNQVAPCSQTHKEAQEAALVFPWVQLSSQCLELRQST